ncbi:MAG: tyrosine--tRNA ligase [Alphaproteobacteria bacterium]|nr:tyrosine--tRNA ligase [Alphaproteobacteria bacterium]
MIYKSDFVNEALARGFLYQSTNLEDMDTYLATPGKRAYVGFDITAKSLHVGHLLPIFTMRLFQKHGHQPILIVGGGTTKIGDPSFRNTTRPMLTDDQIAENLKGIKACLMPFLKFGDEGNSAIMLNNDTWLGSLNYLDFLREIGTFFSVNRMIGFDSVKTKLQENNSLSFLEFNYMIMQGYDFYTLFKEYNCPIQLGGQDQWGNIVCGIDLIRKKAGKEAYGFTNPLLTTSDGKKMGKTANGAVWLSPELMSAYDFWQYWRNVNDDDVIKLLYLFSDIPVQDIKKMENIHGQELNELKILLADSVTTIIHGKESLNEIHQCASGMFGQACNDLSKMSQIRKHKINMSQISNTSIIDILVDSQLCNSRSDAKRLLRGRGVYINDETIDENFKFSADTQSRDMLKLSCGKKKNVILLIE